MGIGKGSLLIGSVAGNNQTKPTEGEDAKKFGSTSSFQVVNSILCFALGKPHYLWVRGRQDAEIAITLANRLIFASFFQNILFGP